MTNPYLPCPMRLERIVLENDDRDLKTFKLVFLDPEHEKAFNHLPG